MRLVDSILCRTEEFAMEMFEFYIKRGYSVLKSTVQIESGTHGKHVVNKLDILSEEKPE